MENENKPMSYEEKSQQRLKQETEKQERIERIQKDAVKRLQTDPAILQYFSGFDPYWVSSFIEGYAHKLMMTLEHSATYNKMYEQQATEYTERAETCLQDIQLKKLFDLWCRWSANQAACPGMNTSADFFSESGDVLNCKLLPPISQQEFDLYMQYARSADFNFDESRHFDWLDVTGNRGAQSDSDEEDTQPSWFTYHNTYTGSQVYRALPDIRGQLEDKYRSLFFEERDGKEQEKKAESGPQPEKLPRISVHYYADVLAFMKKFEKPETARLFEMMAEFGSIGGIRETEEENDNDWINEQVESIMHHLTTMTSVKIPVEANADWRQALIDGWKKFETQQTIAALPAAYDNYLFMIENKIAFSGKRHPDYARVVNEQILRGRVLCGEPANFDF